MQKLNDPQVRAVAEIEAARSQVPPVPHRELRDRLEAARVADIPTLGGDALLDRGGVSPD